MPWLSKKSHVRHDSMNTSFSQPLTWIKVSGLLSAMMAVIVVCSSQVLATESGKKKAVRSKGINQSKSVDSGDSFQLSLSNIPYSTDPESDYVRIYCAPKNKHSSKKKNN